MAKTDAAPLTDSQREIMEIVWDRGEVAVSEVWDELGKRRDVARNTVQTLIVRLEDKGWLTHREEGRTFFYAAARSRTKSLGAKVAQMIDRLFAGSPEEMVTALIEYRGLSSEEAERIRAMIEQSESSRNAAGKRTGRKS